MNNKRIKSILIYCEKCKKKHRMSLQPCLSCSGRGGHLLQPISDHVCNNCSENYECDGCESYRDHTDYIGV